MAMIVLLFAGALFVAYSNGANDNFKGVATLYGSKALGYKASIGLATVTTFAGSVCSIFIAQSLVSNFSGKGLVPDTLTVTPEFLTAVALGAGLTVLIASFFGFPISTTHGLTGALTGAGFLAVGSQLNTEKLGSTFFIPLLISPLVSVVVAAIVYVIFRQIRIWAGIREEHCICVGTCQTVIPTPRPAHALSFQTVTLPEITVGDEVSCQRRYGGAVMGISAQRLVDVLHYLSAAMVSFARGLNDTPKIVGLVFAAQIMRIEWSMVAIAIAMAIGGLLNARKVARTMSKKITSMNHGQGLTANLVTGFLVIFASRWGLPVSTTHVSVGAISGIGIITGQADFKVIGQVVLSWALTLPIAAVIAACIYYLIQ
ncbi:inorganic phosphate transporter [bacterium]|nr:inorganic phosphate transporter [bacterium]NUN45262.1 inorganic phosphate transporter [bacterium]